MRRLGAEFGSATLNATSESLRISWSLRLARANRFDPALHQGDQNHKRRPGALARHRNSPHMAYWRMIKQGYDHFELTHLEPKVDVCEKRYVIGALSTYSFSPADRCPAYEVPKQVAAAVRDKQRRDDIRMTELIMRGSPGAPVTTGVYVLPCAVRAQCHLSNESTASVVRRKTTGGSREIRSSGSIGINAPQGAH